MVSSEYFVTGERIATTKQVRDYKKQMRERGIKVVVDKKEKHLQGRRIAGFDYSEGIIYIKKRPGVIDLYHEGFHAEQYRKIGPESYRRLDTLAREEFVYGRIMENSRLFNMKELQYAKDYIMKLRGKM